MQSKRSSFVDLIEPISSILLNIDIHTKTYGMGQILLNDTHEVAALRAITASIPDLNIYRNGFVIVGAAGSSIDHNTLICWMIDYANQNGPDKMVETLKIHSHSNSHECMEIVLIQGLSIQHSYQLTKEISLYPIENVPSVSFKEELEFLKNNREFQPIDHISWHGFLDRKIYAHAALVRTFTQSPAIEQGNPLFKPRPSAKQERNKKILDQQVSIVDMAIVFCTLLGPSGALPIARWFEPNDDVPLKGYTGNFSHSNNAYGQITASVATPTESQSTQFSGLFSTFLEIDPTLQKRILISIQRLNSAIRRSDPVEKAIDLGVAIEALILTETSDNAVLFRTRGALLIGKTDITQRIEINAKLKAIYALRSKAAHGGTFADTSKILGNNISSLELLGDGIALCSDMIREIINLKFIPDWEVLMLGGGTQKSQG